MTGPVDTTIVVPTFNEAGNVTALVRGLESAFPDGGVEVLFVDDSTDNTPHRIADVAERAVIPVRLVHRPAAERIGGLAGAVARGIREAVGEYVLVMDGDLQHPPSMAPTLRAAAEGADLAVASRYGGQGDAEGLGTVYRRLVSNSSTLLAQACFPRRVGRVSSDPMSGFFCVRRGAIDLERLRPRGFKILLEVLARHDLVVREVPFTFGERQAGASKASWRNGLHFVHQLASLRMGRMVRFATVGALGTVVNLLAMVVLVHGHALPYLAAAVVAAEVSILFNFVLLERFVFADVRAEVDSRGRRLVAHVAFNSAEAIIRLPLLALAVEVVGLNVLVAQAATLVAAFLLRFLFTSHVVYRIRPPRPALVRLRRKRPAPAGAQHSEGDTVPQAA